MYQNRITHALYYLDDFLFIDQAATPADQAQLQVALCTCQTLGVPVAPDKVHFPTNKLSFLGIEIDASSLELCLPEPKLMELRHTLHSWRSKRSCTKRELLLLIGQLHHAAAVVKPGRTFLCRLIDSSTTVAKLHHHIRLTSSAHADIEWWLAFLTRWNGLATYRRPTHTPSSNRMRLVPGAVGQSGATTGFRSNGQTHGEKLTSSCCQSWWRQPCGAENGLVCPSAAGVTTLR